jgi:hypothetical protein
MKVTSMLATTRIRCIVCAFDSKQRDAWPRLYRMSEHKRGAPKYDVRKKSTCVTILKKVVQPSDQ